MKYSTIMYSILTLLFVGLICGDLYFQSKRIDFLENKIAMIPTTTPQYTAYKEPTFTIKTTARVENTDCWIYCQEMLKQDGTNCRNYCEDSRELTQELKLSDAVLLLLDYTNIKYQPEVKTENYTPAKFVK